MVPIFGYSPSAGLSSRSNRRPFSRSSSAFSSLPGSGAWSCVAFCFALPAQAPQRASRVRVPARPRSTGRAGTRTATSDATTATDHAATRSGSRGQAAYSHAQERGEREPHANAEDVDDDERPQWKVKPRNEYDDGNAREQVAGAPEECLDSLQCFVLRVPGRRQKQRAPDRVLQRIVRGVLRDFGDSNHREHGCEGKEAVAAERDQRQDEQRAADAEILEYARDQEELHSSSTACSARSQRPPWCRG